MGKLLFVDDDLDLLETIKISIEKEGHTILLAGNGRDGLKAFYQFQPDLVVLDVMMPVMDGRETCRRIRELSDTPVLFLSAKGEEEDIVRGFTDGADDYLLKPFSMKILKAKIDAVLKRDANRDKHNLSHVFSIGPIEIDLAAREVKRDGMEVFLTPTEFNLLAYLVKNAGRVMTHEELLQQVWGWEYRDETQYLKLYVSYLRKKLEENPKIPRLILTERGVGYRFVKESAYQNGNAGNNKG